MENSIRILGSCIIRDIFGFHQNNGGYIIEKYVNIFSPLFLDGPKVNINLSDWSNTNVPDEINFFKENALLDLTGNVINYIKSPPGITPFQLVNIMQNKTHNINYIKTLQQYKYDGWLLIDTTILRHPYFLLNNKQIIVANKTCDFMSKSRIVPSIDKILPFDFLTPIDLIYKLKTYADIILSIVPSKRIILFELKNIYTYKNYSKNYINCFQQENLCKQNNLLEFAFYALKSFLGNCHVVYMPNFIIGDSKHKWGLYPLHYEKDYYEYGLKAINTIIRSRNKSKQKQLENLFESHNFYFYNSILNQKVNNLHYETSNSELNMRILKLCKYISHYYFYKLLSKICPFLIKKISNKISKYKNHLIHHL